MRYKVLLAALFFVQAAVSQASPSVIGTASNSQGETLYTEKHFTNGQGFTHKVSYFAQGKEFASKTINQGQTPASPSVKLTDTRSGQKYSVESDGENVIFSFKKTAQSKTKKGKTAINKPLIIDAGFNAFIQNHWQALNKGEKLTVFYALPTRQSLAKLVVSKNNNCAKAHCFTIAVKNWFLALIVDKLKLSYNEQKQLLSFQGPSNIVDKNGKTLNVTIQYRYIK